MSSALSKIKRHITSQRKLGDEELVAMEANAARVRAQLEARGYPYKETKDVTGRICITVNMAGVLA
jgi:hypothetical protein